MTLVLGNNKENHGRKYTNIDQETLRYDRRV